VLRVGWDAWRVLFAGDIEAAAEKLLSTGDCGADVLKAPHHGSATSNSDVFLDAVRPHAVVVSTRDTGRLRPLGRGVADRYAARGLHLWRTDQHGGIRAAAKGGQLLLSGARDARGYTLETSADKAR
jgi:competence protein ComEC